MHAIRSLLVVIFLLTQFASAQAQTRPPERGQDQSTVETRFGAPLRIEGPVGEPPITKWVYADYIVVFEYDRVLHTVQRQPVVEQTPTDQAPSPGTGPANSTDRQGTGDTLTIPQ